MTAPTTLLKKLQIKSGAKLWLVNVPRALAAEISAGAEVEIVREADGYDGVLVFFDAAADVQALMPRILAHMPYDGLLWVAYRKGRQAKAAGLSRDLGWDRLDAAGWRPVRVVALDDTWSALRFRPRELVKAKEGSSFG
ncbi:hypothetical protein [Devosia marina]|uniref:DUF3052 domain-containing protein n=1 Tax=Devosia marina TaxID=2683198 RepID=A0A7X3K343_9HYPH|nr:hypothetical protein [Devosia marina]MVS98194.1 hypothetical protein [Devosia marina]